MPFWIAEGGENGTCACARIKSAVHVYSNDLFQGCGHLSKLAKSFENPFEVRMANSSCIFFGVSCIEARLNEQFSAFSAISDVDGADSGFWKSLEERHIRSSIQNKWNIVANKLSGIEWSNGSEPFQSYNLVVTLRNELVHYKGALYGKAETPNKRIAHVMKTLGVTSSPRFTDDDCSSRSYDLLSSNKLGESVYASIASFWFQFYDLAGISRSASLRAPEPRR